MRIRRWVESVKFSDSGQLSAAPMDGNPGSKSRPGSGRILGAGLVGDAEDSRQGQDRHRAETGATCPCFDGRVGG